MTRRATAVLALALSALSGGCRRGIPPDVVVYARGADSESLDPQGIDDGESAKVIQNLYDGLVEFGSGSTEIVPDLATTWETSPDGLDWTFHLRDGVKFHDGTTFEAADVVFTFERILDRANPFRPNKMPYQNFFSDHIESVTAKDPRTVAFRLKHPYAPFLSNLAMFSAFIVGPEALEAKGVDGFARNPVGTGPFRFVAWDFGQKKITLEANPEYWRRPARLARVIFTTIPDNNSRLVALRSGDCNWMDGLNPEDLDACRKDPDLKVWSDLTMNVGYLAMNTTRKPFDDVRVRRAVALAIDRKKLVEALYLGMGKPAAEPLPPGILGSTPGAAPAPPDREKAKALLAEAGFPGGFDTELYAMPNPRPYYPNPQKIAQVFKSDLATVGIRVTIDPVGDWAQYLEAVQNAKHPMCMLGWTTDNGDPDNFLYTFFSEKSAEVGPGALNMAFWVDPRMQDLLRRGQTEVDPAKREAIYREAVALVLEAVPLIPVAHSDNPFVSSKGFEGFVVQPTGDVLLYPVRPVATE